MMADIPSSVSDESCSQSLQCGEVLDDLANEASAIRHIMDEVLGDEAAAATQHTMVDDSEQEERVVEEEDNNAASSTDESSSDKADWSVPDSRQSEDGLGMSSLH